MKENNVENIKETMQSGAFFMVTRKLRPNDKIGPDAEIDVANTDKPIPMFTKLTVDGHKITVSAKETDKIQWIANGKVIDTNKVNGTGTVTLDLDTVERTEGLEDLQYVRVELFGEGGLCLSQALVIDDGSEDLNFEEEINIAEKLIDIFRGTKLYTLFSELIKLIKGQ